MHGTAKTIVPLRTTTHFCEIKGESESKSFENLGVWSYHFCPGVYIFLSLSLSIYKSKSRKKSTTYLTFADLNFHFRATWRKVLQILDHKSSANLVLVFTCHPKAAKRRGLVSSLVASAISISCQHMLHARLTSVIHWLTEVEYAESLVSAAILSYASGERFQKTNVSYRKKQKWWFCSLLRGITQYKISGETVWHFCCLLQWFSSLKDYTYSGLRHTELHCQAPWPVKKMQGWRAVQYPYYLWANMCRPNCRCVSTRLTEYLKKCSNHSPWLWKMFSYVRNLPHHDYRTQWFDTFGRGILFYWIMFFNSLVFEQIEKFIFTC